MSCNICRCVYAQNINEPVTTLSLVSDFLFSILVIIGGSLLNVRFKKKLQAEKRNTPIGRKGNVIEPIMRWYLNLVIIFWPYQMLLLWMNAHEIMPASWFANCWLLNILYNPLRIGRVIIMYNSFFIALIRYIYIVHNQKAENWNFKKVGDLLRIASVTVPISVEVVRIFIEIDFPGLKSTERFMNCFVANEGLKRSSNITLPLPAPVVMSMSFLPPQLIHGLYYIYLGIIIIIGSNITEAYMYLEMFKTIKRHVKNVYKLSDLNFIKRTNI